ncbi:MerR family transcriptional regulator [Acetobacterium paludosum]|uniref:MerR family transcriptional regulator n=1 Tax=Acetobacterium paludosum TaxID=52693 RepID=A0A923KQ53_9FIRM|nr:MerR family transcriptional regulator [Acetobacterium paludosum]MBC3888799.1 MerR family transcriptional regulator [Acetobacterium paludosum]
MKKDKLFTVGEIAKQMGVTVRTLQYYDKINLLKPNETSAGGRRLYSQKDMVELHQILSLKYLGFSLDEIKNKLFSLDTPQEVCSVLEQQKEIIKEEIINLQTSLDAINALHDEVIAIDSVDFGKYADIIAMLRNENKNYWVIKNFSPRLEDHVREKYMDMPDDGKELYERYLRILDEAVILSQTGEPIDSEKSISLAKRWWDMVMDFTGGDMSLLPELQKFNLNSKEGWNAEIAKKQEWIDDFLGAILAAYFNQLGYEFPAIEEEQK